LAEGGKGVAGYLTGSGWEADHFSRDKDEEFIAADFQFEAFADFSE
jgi:hypothetical protein